MTTIDADDFLAILIRIYFVHQFSFNNLMHQQLFPSSHLKENMVKVGSLIIVAYHRFRARYVSRRRALYCDHSSYKLNRDLSEHRLPLSLWGGRSNFPAGRINTVEEIGVEHYRMIKTYALGPKRTNRLPSQRKNA